MASAAHAVNRRTRLGAGSLRDPARRLARSRKRRALRLHRPGVPGRFRGLVLGDGPASVASWRRGVARVTCTRTRTRTSRCTWAQSADVPRLCDPTGDARACCRPFETSGSPSRDITDSESFSTREWPRRNTHYKCSKRPRSPCAYLIRSQQRQPDETPVPRSHCLILGDT
jgi:hypothetical protein